MSTEAKFTIYKLWSGYVVEIDGRKYAAPDFDKMKEEIARVLNNRLRDATRHDDAPPFNLTITLSPIAPTEKEGKA